MSRWFLCQTKSIEEVRAKWDLDNQCYEAWFPTLKGGALLPGYVFVVVGDHQEVHPFNSTRGVIHLLDFRKMGSG